MIRKKPIAAVFSSPNGLMVSIGGWIQRVRNLKNVQFVVLRDRTGQVQITHERSESTDPLAELIESLAPESVVLVHGTVSDNPNVKLGGKEIIAESIEVLSSANTPLPLQAGAKQDDRLNWRFLDLRRPEQLLIFQIQTAAEDAMRRFWVSHGFIEIHSPKLMATPSESGAELFRVKYFDGEAFLAQSPQFYKQMAMAAGFDRVFEIGPVFRANPSFTPRHDTEFTSVDVEMAWVESHYDVMEFEESWLSYVLSEIRRQYGEAIKTTFGVEIVLPKVPFPKLTMAEAWSIVESQGHRPKERGDLDPAGERLVSEYVRQNYGHEFVFITDYPASVRPFYHMRPEGNTGITKSFDLLWKGLEVTTGAQREHRYSVLLAQAEQKGLSHEPMQFYLDFFRYGMPPHGGYGFGLTRMLMVMLGRENVREVTYLYRGPTRLRP